MVTELDHILNKEIKDIINSQFPRALIISEEDKVNNKLDYFNSLTFLIDPLDGSQNFSLGLPFYSSLITVIKEKKIIASSNVTHFNHQIITWEKDSGLYSNVELGNISQNGPSLAVSDLNNDGYEDLIVSGSSKSEESIYFQDKNDYFYKKKGLN